MCCNPAIRNNRRQNPNTNIAERKLLAEIVFKFLLSCLPLSAKTGIRHNTLHTVNATQSSNKVTVEEDCMINVNGPKVTFYLGDNNNDEEKFIVTGNNTTFKTN